MATVRTVARSIALVIAWALAAGVAPALAAVHVVSEPEVSAPANQYATLTFPLGGTGSYRFEIAPPDGWVVVTRDGAITVDGDGFISVTLRVPAFAPAGERFATQLRLLAGERLVTSATGLVLVARRTQVGVHGPDELVGDLGAQLAFDVVVVNEGNARETVLLSARHTHWDVRFDSPETVLEPAERRAVRVTLRPTTTVNSGYRHIFYLVATPGSDPAAEVVSQVTSQFFSGGQPLDASATERPRLTLSLRAAAAAALEIDAQGVSAGATYHVQPGLAGQLSDYVRGSLDTNRLAGSLTEPFEELPSSAALSLEGPNWDGSLSLSARRYALDVGVDLERWRVSAGGAWDPGRTIGASVRLERSDHDLQFFARTAGQPARRTDAVEASYTTELAERLTLTVGAGITGFADHGAQGGYEAALSVRQRLTWRDDAFDVSQSYAGVPFAGVHTIGVTGGSRRLYPLGVRAYAAYSASPVSDRWAGSITVFGRPAPSLTLDVTGGVTMEASAVRRGVSWSVSPRLIYNVRRPAGLAGTFSVRYGHGGAASGSGSVWDRYELGARLTYQRLAVTGTGEYEVRRSEGTATPEVTLKTALQSEYLVGADDLLFGSYRYEQSTWPVARSRHEIGVGWTRAWSTTIASRVEYQRTVDLLGDADRERVSVGLSVADVLTPGLALTAGYSVTSPTSLLDFATPLRHDLRVGVGYAVPIVFDTPDAVIDLFGGRRGGEVHGVAFVGADPGDAPTDGARRLAGLEIQVGPERTTTDEAGNYRVRVPEGTHALAFPTGLPATVRLLGAATIEVVENERLERALVFAPVVNLTVEVFEDHDRDGVRGLGESGIPYAGVVLDGPERRLVRTDGSGRAVASGLAVGTYRVGVSPDHLPNGYSATTPSASVTLRAGDRPDGLRLGAARAARTIVQTYSGDGLAVLPRSLQTSVAPGAEIELEALVQGTVERLSLIHDGVATHFSQEGSRWHVRYRIPPGTAFGLLTLSVLAEGGGARVERQLVVNVVDRPVIAAPGVIAAVGGEALLELETHFRAASASMTMPCGEVVPLDSRDGYRWSAIWRAPAEAGRFLARVSVDGQELGVVAISVLAPPPRERASSDAAAPTERAARGDGEGSIQ
jgi:hypothetical protein